MPFEEEQRRLQKVEIGGISEAEESFVDSESEIEEIETVEEEREQKKVKMKEAVE